MENFEIKYDANYKLILNDIEVKRWMEYRYNINNVLFFDNMLPPLGHIILMPIIKYVGYLGRAYGSNTNDNMASIKSPYIIKLNFAYDLTEIEWENVLLHEMIHIWQYTMGYTGGHGKSFKMKAKEINEYGWGITSTYKNILEDIKYARDREKNN